MICLDAWKSFSPSLARNEKLSGSRSADKNKFHARGNEINTVRSSRYYTRRKFLKKFAAHIFGNYKTSGFQIKHTHTHTLHTPREKEEEKVGARNISRNISRVAIYPIRRIYLTKGVFIAKVGIFIKDWIIIKILPFHIDVNLCHEITPSAWKSSVIRHSNAYMISGIQRLMFTSVLIFFLRYMFWNLLQKGRKDIRIFATPSTADLYYCVYLLFLRIINRRRSSQGPDVYNISCLYG